MELGAAAHPRAGRQHLTSPPRERPQRRSDADPRTALTAACREDATAGPGAHAQPESVRLGPTPIVRLERALAHRKLQIRVKDLRATAIARPRHTLRLARAATCHVPQAARAPLRAGRPGQETSMSTNMTPPRISRLRSEPGNPRNSRQSYPSGRWRTSGLTSHDCAGPADLAAGGGYGRRGDSRRAERGQDADRPQPARDAGQPKDTTGRRPRGPETNEGPKAE